MSMNTPIGNITQTTPIKNFKELDEMQNEQYLLGIDNNAVGNGSKISLENLINSLISTDNGNLITKGTDDRLLVNTPVEIGDLSDLTTTNKSTLVVAINEVDSDIIAEATTRQNADNNLQSQIDAITAASDVTDIVGTYAELQAYDTTGLPDNSIIKVLQNESRQDETTYYRWVITGGIGAWVLIGEEGPYYTISQSDSKFATQETVGNLNNLATSDKSSVINAMNELASVLDPTQTADYIKNSKAIYSGEVSENALILPQIKEMARSTFDLAKFTVVGSPTITDDGVASGFSDSNYLTYSEGLTTFKTIEYYSPTIKVLGSLSGYALLGDSTTNAISFGIEGGTTFLAVYAWWLDGGEGNYRQWIINDISVGSNYQFKWVVNGTSVSAYVSINGGEFTQIGTEATFPNTVINYNIGGRIGDHSVTGYSFQGGTLDLKQFSITVDGVEVFSGNKTGIDTIKPDNYTVVGTPTISADGVASGFSNSNYLTLPFDNTATNFKVYYPFKTGSSLPVNNAFVLQGAIVFFVLVSGGTMEFKYGSATSGLTYMSSSFWKADTNYCLEVIRDGGNTVTFNLLDLDRNGAVCKTYDLDVTGIILTTNTLELSKMNSTSIDLNAFRIYVDGNLVYQPCLKIPYTESKTGSKIVDAIYRDRVNDMAEQFGYANYYTLDEDNGNFTLPQVELYGYIEKRARDIAHPVAQPFYRFSDEINDDEVRLEGAEVDKGLYLAIEQDPYLSALCTAGSTSDKICLPDFRNRVLYGDVASGYVEPELPNIVGQLNIPLYTNRGTSGAFYEKSSGGVFDYGSNSGGYTAGFDASRSSSIYKDNATVKTAGVKARWLCRWK